MQLNQVVIVGIDMIYIMVTTKEDSTCLDPQYSDPDHEVVLSIGRPRYKDGSRNCCQYSE